MLDLRKFTFKTVLFPKLKLDSFFFRVEFGAVSAYDAKFSFVFLQERSLIRPVLPDELAVGPQPTRTVTSCACFVYVVTYSVSAADLTDTR